MICVLGEYHIGKIKLLNTRVSVRTSCLRKFGQNSPQLNEKKCVLKKFFSEVLQCVKLENK